MNKVYTRIEWKNYPSTDTAVNEANLNKMDFAIDEIDKRVVEQDITKANVSALNELITSWTIDKNTGVITIYKVSGEQIIFDLNIEKVPVGFSLTDEGILIMTTDDGTEFTANIGSMIPVLTFEDSEQIAVKVSGEGVNKTYSFSIKTGSITADKLQPNFLADVTLQANNAKTSADNAKTSEENAKESEINAKNYADSTEPIASTISGLNPTLPNSTDAPIISMQIDGATTQEGTPTPDAPVEIHGVGASGSVEVKSTGKNLFDEVNYNKYIYSTTVGADLTTIASNRYGVTDLIDGSKDIFISCIENKDITCILWGIKDDKIALFKSGAEMSYKGGAYDYLVVGFGTISGVNLTTDALINAECMVEFNTWKTDYEPYTETTANIPLSAPLYEGDYIKYNMDGSGEERHKMVKEVFDESNTYTVFPNSHIAVMPTSKPKKPSMNIFSDRYKQNGTYNLTENNMFINSEGVVVFAEKRFTTLDEWKAWLTENPITVVYELTEPTVTPLTAGQIAEFEKLRTFDGVTNVTCECETEISYFSNSVGGKAVASIVKKLEEAGESENYNLDKDYNVSKVVRQLYNPNSENSHYQYRWNSDLTLKSAYDTEVAVKMSVEGGKTYFANAVVGDSYALNKTTGKIVSILDIMVDKIVVKDVTHYSLFTLPQGYTELYLTLARKDNVYEPIVVEYDKLTVFNKYVYEYGEVVHQYKTKKPLTGVKYAAIGDSITWYDGNVYSTSSTTVGGSRCIGYQSYIAESLGVEKINMGYSGQHSTYMLQQVNATSFKDIDIVTIMTGMNDGGNNLSVDTFKSNIRNMVDKIQTDNPRVKIFLLSQTFGKFKYSQGAFTEGWTTDTYVNAMKEVALEKNIPFYDNFHSNGINKNNYTYYMADNETVNYSIHPNLLAFKIIGTQISNWMHSLLV